MLLVFLAITLLVVESGKLSNDGTITDLLLAQAEVNVASSITRHTCFAVRFGRAAMMLSLKRLDPLIDQRFSRLLFPIQSILSDDDGVPEVNFSRIDMY